MPEASAQASKEPIAALLRLARRQTGMDVAMLGRIHDGHEIVDALAGDAASFGMTVGQRLPLESTFCHLLLEGRIGNIVSDAASHELLSDLQVTRAAGVGAYIGVPLTSPAATLFVLCCLAHERRPALGDHHVDMLRRLAQNVALKLGVS